MSEKERPVLGKGPASNSDFMSFGEASHAVQVAMMRLKEQSPSIHKLLRESEERLVQLGVLLQSYPSLCQEQGFGPYHRSIDTLIDMLCSLDPLELKLRLPSKAVLAEGYMTSKIQQCKGLYLAASSFAPRLQEELFDELGNTIHTYLLYQLLLDVVLSKQPDRKVKRVAARHLVQLWDNCVSPHSLARFFDLIRSLWNARIHLQVSYGSLLGTTELLQLMNAKCDPAVLEYFAGSHFEKEQAQAFQEFLFGLSFEEIRLLRKTMKERGVSVIDKRAVAGILGHASMNKPSPLEDPHVVYRSYKRRRLKARYRRTASAPGPHQTAEEYIVHDLLQKNLRERHRKE